VSNKKNIVVFASGTGSNFISIYNQIKKRDINGSIVLLISNNINCLAIDFAKNNNINTYIIDKVKYEESLLQKIESLETDLIVLAGYLKMIPLQIILNYKNRMLNIHPSLLPKFGGKGYYGMNVHKAAIESGDSISGATVHFVNEKYDDGPIIKQEKIKINKNDNAESIAKRILKIEHILLPFVVKAFCEDRILWQDNQPLIIKK